MSDFSQPGSRILVIDDEEPVRHGVSRQLARVGYTVATAGDGVEAKAALAREPYALALCDIDLPGESGISVASWIAEHCENTAVVMVTGLDDPALAETALAHGAYGYIIKPFERNELLINVSNALRRRTLEMENRAHREGLEVLVRVRTDELHRAHQELIERLVSAADCRDPETAAHIQRMSRYSELLAGRAGLAPGDCELIRLAAPMHDIGKIGIPDDVLLKTGRFTDEDRAIMEQHTEIGYRLLSGSDSPLVNLAADIAHTHHEWFDGTGYPNHLKGTEIPICGRIVAIADVFDALRTRRRYKESMSMEEALALMLGERGRHFDPDLLDLFVNATTEIEEIGTSIQDPVGAAA